MADSSREPATFLTQANALLRKNLIFQKRNIKTNISLITFPIVLCLLILLIKIGVGKLTTMSKCGCACVHKTENGTCDETECGVQYSTPEQVPYCPIPSPPRMPPLLQVPQPGSRAARTNFLPFTDLPDDSCRRNGSCPVTMLLTGGNQSFGESLRDNLFSNGFYNGNSSDIIDSLANLYMGSDAASSDIINPAFPSDSQPIFDIRPQCSPNARFFVSIPMGSVMVKQEVRCLPSLHLWRKSSSVMADEIYKGYQYGNSEDKINEIAGAYDFLNSNEKNFNVHVWYNASSDASGLPLEHAPSLLNAVSNAFLQFLKGSDVNVQFDYIKEMPRPPQQGVKADDILSSISTLFFTWVIMQLFPVLLASLVYEKQQKLRMMMKMHGLGDGPYWMISYAYFFFLSSFYMLAFVVFGSILEFKFFTANSYSIQFVFYFIYINLQIAFAFLAATFFSNVKTATVTGYIYVLASGLLGSIVFQQNTSFPRVGLIIMEILPCLSLYRGLSEFGDYSSTPAGMRWGDLKTSGMREILIIMTVEWIIVLPVSYYLDQVVSVGSGVRRHPLYMFKNFQKKPSASSGSSNRHEQGEGVSVQMEKVDVSLERKRVEQLLEASDSNYAIICDNLKKKYPGTDGNPGKFAVRELSLAIPRGECFGMLGPNGAGKSSSINMMIGLMTPTSGTTIVHGMDIRTDMDKIYSSMGVCPQHDLLWESLTGREHLLFYGRLKNLKGSALAEAVETSLKCLNLFNGGVADKQAGKYSGGMKRRLSVAISLIGDPKVVYMDEPSTGLDPASRNLLWNVVKSAKHKCAIILTTHSMEEAEALCDRIGIFCDGSLQCIGYSTELKVRYGGSYVLTVTTSGSQDKEVEHFVQRCWRSAKKIYHISGTQKFELQKNEVRISDVFSAIQKAKSKFPIHAWGIAETTLEDVFIKVAEEAHAFNLASSS